MQLYWVPKSFYWLAGKLNVGKIKSLQSLKFIETVNVAKCCSIRSWLKDRLSRSYCSIYIINKQEDTSMRMIWRDGWFEVNDLNSLIWFSK